MKPKKLKMRFSYNSEGDIIHVVITIADYEHLISQGCDANSSYFEELYKKLSDLNNDKLN